MIPASLVPCLRSALHFFFLAPFFRQLEGVPSLRPQGQATVALRGSVVDDAVERRAFASLRLQRLPPGTSKSRTGDCLLHRDRKHAPPAPRPSCCRCRAHGEGGAVRLETHQVSHEASGLSVPAAAHLGAEHDERLRPPSRELRVRGVLAALSHPQHGSVHGRCARLRVPRSRERGNQRGVAALRPPAAQRPVHDEVESATVLRSDLRGGGVGQPLLQNDLTFRPHRFPGDLHPGSLHDLGPPGEESSARARKCVVAEAVYCATAAMGRPAGVVKQIFRMISWLIF